MEFKSVIICTFTIVHFLKYKKNQRDIKDIVVKSLCVLLALNFTFILMGICGLRGVYFLGMREANIPMIYTGTAAGLIPF